MEITIIDTDETARQKLSILNRRFTFVFRYINLLLWISGMICILAGLSSGYTNHSSHDGHHTYTDYHIGTGIGIGALIIAAYLELYIFKLRQQLNKFKHSPTTYVFSDSSLKMSSVVSDCMINWRAIQKITPLKTCYLIITNNYSCPTIIILKSQISPDQLGWITNQIRKN